MFIISVFQNGAVFNFVHVMSHVTYFIQRFLSPQRIANVSCQGVCFNIIYVGIMKIM